MCHGFLSSKDSGERLSHAVGCAFAVCLERKQRRDKECGVTMTFDMKNSTFTRTGSFRQQTMTERINDGMNGTQTATVAPQQKAYNPFAIERPHATPSMLERQGSFRGFTQIGAQSPFKRQMSLRINDLPSNAERQRAFLDTNQQQRSAVSPIPEISPQPSVDTVSQLCQELSQGLSMLSHSDTDEFNKLTNGIINKSATVGMHSPSKTRTSPIHTGYSPMSVYSTNSSIPVGTAAPMQIQTEPPLLPTRFNSLVAVTQTNTTFITSVLNSIAESAAESSGVPVASPPQPPPLPLPVIPRSTDSSPEKIVPIETVAPLPKPEQWLTEVVKSTSPAPKRAPALSTQSRTKSLNSSDPFDAEWASGVVKPVHSTNPFISPQRTPAPIQSFQVQL